MYITPTLLWGYSSVSGRRASNEDAHVVTDLKGLRPDLTESITFAAVYDGHGGPQASAFAQGKLHLQLAKALSFPEEIEKSLKSAFNFTDKLYLRAEGTPDLYTSAGTTAVVCVEYRGDFYFANAGDSRAIAGLNNFTIVKQITMDHKPSVPSERRRIEEYGSTVVDDDGEDCPRVAGMLAVSRAIGDGPFKSCGVIAVPDTFRVPGETVDFVVLACDGLWDVMSNNDVAVCVRAVFDIAKTDYAGARPRDLSKDCERARKLTDIIGKLVRASGPEDELHKTAIQMAEQLAPRPTTGLEFLAGYPGFRRVNTTTDSDTDGAAALGPGAAKFTPEAIGMYLTQLAIALGSEDNVTVVVGVSRKAYPEKLLRELEAAVGPK